MNLKTWPFEPLELRHDWLVAVHEPTFSEFVFIPLDDTTSLTSGTMLYHDRINHYEIYNSKFCYPNADIPVGEK